MKSISKIITAILLLSTTISFSQTPNTYKVIYSADSDGMVISGSTEELITAVNEGNPLRVGWDVQIRTKDSIYQMTHWTDAGFITLLEGHVFAQIKSIYGQGPKFPKEGEIAAVMLSNDEPDGWVAIIGTTGVMRQKFKRDEEMIVYLSKTMNEKEIAAFLKENEVQKVATKWAVPIQ